MGYFWVGVEEGGLVGPMWVFHSVVLLLDCPWVGVGVVYDVFAGVGASFFLDEEFLI